MHSCFFPPGSVRFWHYDSRESRTVPLAVTNARRPRGRLKGFDSALRVAVPYLSVVTVRGHSSSPSCTRSLGAARHMFACPIGAKTGHPPGIKRVPFTRRRHHRIPRMSARLAARISRNLLCTKSKLQSHDPGANYGNCSVNPFWAVHHGAVQAPRRSLASEVQTGPGSLGRALCPVNGDVQGTAPVSSLRN